MWDKNMMHFGKPFVKKMQLLRIQFPLLRHILYARNLPSEHAGMGSNTLWAYVLKMDGIV